MDVIKGSELNVPDAIFAWQLDGKGGILPVDSDSVIDSEHPCWLYRRKWI